MLKNNLAKCDKPIGNANFRFSPSKIEIEPLKASLENSHAGALVCFEGVVRNHNEGKVVLNLEYEAYESLANNEADKILNEAQQNFSIISAVCVHRTGLLEIGEAAVFVGVTSAHRDASFQACRYIIDEIKTRLPIWKKETYQDGSAKWVNCQHTQTKSPGNHHDTHGNHHDTHGNHHDAHGNHHDAHGNHHDTHGNHDAHDKHHSEALPQALEELLTGDTP